ncbi:hypothetical protein [Nitrosospira sp. NpAV]|uniref:hypothetical protein n=1 Tax=Nitrosospira sp. NpAV TaxID=58133 RepID=UPI0005A1DE8D|nr:hypothetical protein [Nitrosospira sp. NpAV]KIO50286.1 hypothetical protein SQ11_00855 [Nitrosospira sp. NpAV]
MASPKATVKFTANFEFNLASIDAFWLDQEASHAFMQLLEDLEQTIIDNLERHPGIGRRFFARSPQSLEVRDRVSKLQQRLGNIDVREYLSGDYLILYGAEDGPGTTGQPITVYLLTIRHYRQLSFDLEGFWQANRGEPV